MNILLIGDSGHARVIADIVNSSGNQIVAKLDDKYAELFKEDGCWFGPVSEVGHLLGEEQAKVIVAIGANSVRRKIVERLALNADQYATAIHKDAIVSPSAAIGHGTVVMPGAVVNAAAIVGDHTIINSRSVVEHDCVVGDYVHVSPGATVAGVTKLGEGVLIEAGASVTATKEIGQWSVVRAGSAVIEDVREYTTVMGVPAREVTSEANELKL
ncbi:acetyltransferase [Planococcus shenhongbingii]|uniref:acetyltransferase n=1 Tax=Planococcus shenhongbingii TaxID=3058398 RepID=UPI00260D6349|nr:acetyltransferase [Planococcus sp. N016]WKA57780.1 acetyltransferase [Planococcus sp. N016]